MVNTRGLKDMMTKLAVNSKKEIEAKEKKEKIRKKKIARKNAFNPFFKEGSEDEEEEESEDQVHMNNGQSKRFSVVQLNNQPIPNNS